MDNSYRKVVHYTSTMLFQIGILRYCGCTDFAKGQWAGVELHEPQGKNNGSVGGKTYFQCKPKHGINISCVVSVVSCMMANLIKICFH